MALYLEKNYSQSKLACQSILNDLRNRYLDPVIKNITPDTDFRTIEAAFVRVVTEYNGNGKCKKSVGPASDEVLESFIQVRSSQKQSLKMLNLVVIHVNV